jgi:hypothetical protein
MRYELILAAPSVPRKVLKSSETGRPMAEQAFSHSFAAIEKFPKYPTKQWSQSGYLDATLSLSTLYRTFITSEFGVDFGK